MTNTYTHGLNDYNFEINDTTFVNKLDYIARNENNTINKLVGAINEKSNTPPPNGLYVSPIYRQTLLPLFGQVKETFSSNKINGIQTVAIVNEAKVTSNSETITDNFKDNNTFDKFKSTITPQPNSYADCFFEFFIPFRIFKKNNVQQAPELLQIRDNGNNETIIFRIKILCLPYNINIGIDKNLLLHKDSLSQVSILDSITEQNIDKYISIDIYKNVDNSAAVIVGRNYYSNLLLDIFNNANRLFKLTGMNQNNAIKYNKNNNNSNIENNDELMIYNTNSNSIRILNSTSQTKSESQYTFSFSNTTGQYVYNNLSIFTDLTADQKKVYKYTLTADNCLKLNQDIITSDIDLRTLNEFIQSEAGYRDYFELQLNSKHKVIVTSPFWRGYYLINYEPDFLKTINITQNSYDQSIKYLDIYKEIFTRIIGLEISPNV